MIPSAVEFSMMVSVACCGFPIYVRVVLCASSYFSFYNNAPHYASSTDDITLQMMVDMTIIDPFFQLLFFFPSHVKETSCFAPCL